MSNMIYVVSWVMFREDGKYSKEVQHASSSKDRVNIYLEHTKEARKTYLGLDMLPVYWEEDTTEEQIISLEKAKQDYIYVEEFIDV